MWKRWPQQQDQEIEVSHAGEDHVGADAADETKELERAAARTAGGKTMDRDVARKRGDGIGGLRNQAEMEFIFGGGKVAGQQFGNALRAAAAEVRNEQRPWAVWT